MRKLLSILTGLSLLAPSMPAFAAGDQYADLTPISPYVRRVTDRAREGLAATSAGGTTSDPFLIRSWMNYVTGVILGLVDTELRIVEQERDLLANPPCLRIDTLILEGWMERARKAKNDALEAGNTTEAARLISLQLYLNDRYRALLRGARNPQYLDLTEGDLFSFDAPPAFCCLPKEEGTTESPACADAGSDDARKECAQGRGTLFKRQDACVRAGCTGDETPDEEILCPFDSDYLPPTAAGYGCDSYALAGIAGSAPEGIRQEIEGLQKAVSDRDAFITDMNALRGTLTALEERLTGEPSDPWGFGGGAGGHKVVTGCLDEGEELPDGIAFWERSGPFSFEANEIVLMPKLAILWRNWISQRLPPEYLRSSEELTEGTPEYEEAKNAENNLFFWFVLSVRQNAQEYLQSVSLQQDEAESTQLARTLDAPERILSTLAPLRKQVRTLAETVQSSSGGIRKFVRNFAAFLRVSCIFRPCNEQLDRVLKIDFKDECFPYARGALLDADVADQCKNAAGL